MSEKKLSFKDSIRQAFKDAIPISSTEKSRVIQSVGDSEGIWGSFIMNKKVSGADNLNSNETLDKFEGKNHPVDFNVGAATSLVQSLSISVSKQNTSDSDSEFEEFKRACEFVKHDLTSASLDTEQFRKSVPPWNKAFKEILSEEKSAGAEAQSSNQLLAESYPAEQTQESFDGPGIKSRGRPYKQTNYQNDSKRRPRGSRHQQMSRGCQGKQTYHESMEKVHGFSRSGENYWHNDQDDDSKKRPRGSRQQQMSRACHCCKANREHLTHLRNSNRFGEYRLNDFDGSGVDCFKNSNLAPQLLPNKVVIGNRVYYYGTPNERHPEGFVADFLKPENRKPTVLTEEQKAALEPDEYWEF